MYDVLIEAISNRQIISFDYDGHPRIVQCAAIGKHKSTRNDVLRGYQVGGSGKNRPVPFWHLYKIQKISNLRLLSEKYTADPPGFNKGDKDMSPVDCEL